MKKIIKVSIALTKIDVIQCVQGGWTISTHNKKMCLENQKIIFIPALMQKL